MNGEQSSSAHVAYRAVLLAAGLLLFGLLFRQLVTLLLAALTTVIIAIPLSAAARRFERNGLPRWLGALAALLSGIAVVALLIALLIPPFVDQTNQFADDVPGIVRDLERNIEDSTGLAPGEVGDRVQAFVERYANDPQDLIGPITSIGLSVAGILAALVVMLITAFYMAARPEPLVDGLVRLAPPAQRDHLRYTLERLRRAWIGWMQGVAVDMVVTGVLLYVGLTLVGLDFAIFFAVLSALLVVVPYFGAIAGAIPPTLFALTDSPGKALVVLIVYIAVQQIESNVTIPLVMAQTVRLHPAVIALGVVIVGQLFGFIGLFVAVPILSLIVIGVEEFWVKPLEEADASRSGQLRDRDDHAGQREHDDQDLHPDPKAR
jgi:predicted PurR-regulated permease PerM